MKLGTFRHLPCLSTKTRYHTQDPPVNIVIDDKLTHWPRQQILNTRAPPGCPMRVALVLSLKVVGQLSPTLSRAGCPLLWEAIYPKTSDAVGGVVRSLEMINYT